MEVIGSAVSNFAKRVPEDAEVVTDYKNNTSGSGSGHLSKQHYIQISGTALIPKKK